VKFGWLPWFTDNRLHFLGWVQRDPSGVVFGVELETVTLVARLMEKFPKDESEGIVYALVDATGRVIHQLGRSPIPGNAVPDHEVSLAPHLPHWRIAVYLEPHRDDPR
jgi:two-component system, OmpR family, phosphate regulon sensor histidine kinase PhoR